MKRFLLLIMASLMFGLSLWDGSARALGWLPSKRADSHLVRSSPKNDSVMAFLAATNTPTPIITSTPLENGEIYHVVQLHEALWSIAIAYNTTVDSLKLLNGLSTDEIFEGQKLLVFKPVPDTATPTKANTATMGIPTSTPTHPVTPTMTSTPTPIPTPPASFQNGAATIGTITLVALIAAALGAWLGRKKPG